MIGEPFGGGTNRSWFFPDRTLSVGEFSRGLHEYAPQVEVSDDPVPLTAALAAELLRNAGGVPLARVPNRLPDARLPE